MKKKLLIMVPVIVFVVLFLAVFFNIEKIDNHLTVMEYEKAYQHEKNEADLINLCYYLNQNFDDNSLDEKRIKYSKELINVITEDGIKESVFAETYNESGSDITAKDFAMEWYFVTLLACEEYDLFVKDFSECYLQVDYYATIYLQEVIKSMYNTTKEPLILEYGIKAYEEISKKTGEDAIKKICSVQIDVLEDIKNNDTNQ